MNALKQALYLQLGSSHAGMTLAKENQTRLWHAVRTSEFDADWLFRFPGTLFVADGFLPKCRTSGRFLSMMPRATVAFLRGGVAQAFRCRWLARLSQESGAKRGVFFLRRDSQRSERVEAVGLNASINR